MSILNLIWLIILSLFFFLHVNSVAVAQETQIMGFVAGEMFYEDDQLNFGIGEQDLFITSQLNDNFSFLGETVFKFSPNSPTDFNVSVERIIVARTPGAIGVSNNITAGNIKVVEVDGKIQI